ncbi:chloride channel protein [Paracoccus laeviglucosivorans]|uniref:H+/Cl-antiporter ClcA n=1 Tax=Paracoccus laeviglucosivorans TaxID=1197861 RepID=A0A521FUG9_9RHOB|nr:chloride channel protein [Paracoccus laeviglucosivorans]SMO99762.1 H+/Cl-antiporter ClcA [Paracoccus laeviglucosivorans]
MSAARRSLRVIRRSRAMVQGREQWRGRVVFWCGAVAVGVVSTAFAWLADAVAELFRHVSGGGTALWLLLAVPFGFVSSAWLAQRYFPGSQGSGIPQAMAARALEGNDRWRLLTLRIAAGKFLLTLWGLLFGASIGREGPTVQIGAAIMLASARLGHLAQARGLILAGSAAGIAAAFNTPLAGIVFAIEEMARTYQSRTNGLVLSTVVIAGIAALAISGSYTYLGPANATSHLPHDWLLVAAVGIAGGVLGATFSRSVLYLTRRMRRWKPASTKRKLLLIAGAAGLMVAVTGLLTGGSVFGTSYNEALLAVQGDELPSGFLLAKVIATLASTLSGIPGGIFAPSLSVGAGLGNTIGGMLGASLGFAAVLGMAAYFAGVVQSPMTAFVIVMEMTATQAHALPIMAAAMLGFGVSRLLSPEPLYHGLARLWLADVIRQSRGSAGQ